MRNTPGSGSRFFWDVVTVEPDDSGWPVQEVRIYDRHKGMGRFGENHILTCRAEEYADHVCDALNSIPGALQQALAETPS